MSIRSFPEDSVLRRHCDSAAALKRADWLAQPPTDSVLRRHYQQLRQAASIGTTTAARPAVARTPSPTAPARPEPSPQRQAPQQSRPAAAPAPAPAPEPAPRGGLFGWLSRLFGG
jgi:hypothetical protein